MESLLDFIRKATEYGFNPWLVAVLAVLWLAWKFPAIRAFLMHPVSGNGNTQQYVTRESCQDAQERLGQRFDDAANKIQAEMTAGFTRVHERIDDLLKSR